MSHDDVLPPDGGASWYRVMSNMRPAPGELFCSEAVADHIDMMNRIDAIEEWLSQLVGYGEESIFSSWGQRRRAIQAAIVLHVAVSAARDATGSLTGPFSDDERATPAWRERMVWAIRKIPVRKNGVCACYVSDNHPRASVTRTAGLVPERPFLRCSACQGDLPDKLREEILAGERPDVRVKIAGVQGAVRIDDVRGVANAAFADLNRTGGPPWE